MLVLGPVGPRAGRRAEPVTDPAKQAGQLDWNTIDEVRSIEVIGVSAAIRWDRKPGTDDHGREDNRADQANDDNNESEQNPPHEHILNEGGWTHGRRRCRERNSVLLELISPKSGFRAARFERTWQSAKMRCFGC